MVKNLPAKAGDMGSIPGRGRSHLPQGSWAHILQLQKPLCSTTGEATTMRSPHTAMREQPLLTKTRESWSIETKTQCRQIIIIIIKAWDSARCRVQQHSNLHLQTGTQRRKRHGRPWVCLAKHMGDTWPWKQGGGEVSWGQNCPPAAVWLLFCHILIL